MTVLLLTIVQTLAVLAAGWCLCLAWHAHRRAHAIRILVWPLDDHDAREAQRECAALAAEICVERDKPWRGLQAQWDSGLGHEFPVNHLN